MSSRASLTWTPAPTKVRTTLANYLIALIQIGVRGFRIDSAKHISAVDLDAILTEVAQATPEYPTPFYYFEVEDPGGEAVVPSDYYGVGNASGILGSALEFLYGGIGDRFLNNSGWTLANLKTFGPATWGLIPSDRAIAFTNNHDTQRGDGHLLPERAVLRPCQHLHARVAVWLPGDHVGFCVRPFDSPGAGPGAAVGRRRKYHAGLPARERRAHLRSAAVTGVGSLRELDVRAPGAVDRRDDLLPQGDQPACRT